MFVCANCGKHTEDADLRFEVQYNNRANHPSYAMFAMRLCSDQCALEYLGRRLNYGDFVLTRHKGGPVKTLPPQSPETLVNLIKMRQL